MRPFNEREAKIHYQLIEEALAAVSGVRRCTRIKKLNDPHLLIISIIAEPMIISSVKNSAYQALVGLSEGVADEKNKEDAEVDGLKIIFSTAPQWLNHMQATHLFVVYKNGLQVRVIIDTPTAGADSVLNQLAFSEFLVPMDSANAILSYSEALLVALRYLYSGDALGAQGCLFRGIAAIKQLLCAHYFTAEPGKDILSLAMPKELELLLEMISSNLHPMELANHFVQLTNIVLHLMDQWPGEQLAKIQLLSLIEGRGWLEKGLVFRKQFMDQDTWRSGFYPLAIDTFSLDFAPWYDAGGWNANYQPYAFFHNNRAIANVSISNMSLLIEGEPVKAIQVGTVMTDPAWRRQGLSYGLFQRIFADYPPQDHLYFLAADEMAVPLYTACGFEPWVQQRFWVDLDCQGKKTHMPFTAVEKTSQEMIELYSTCGPVSEHLSATDDHSILLFYRSMGFDSALYEVKEGIYALLKTRETAADAPEELLVYRFFVPRELAYDYNELVQRAKDNGFNRVTFLFTPDQSEKPITHLKSAIDQDASWMVHTGFKRGFPEKAHYPSISQT